MSQRRLLQSLDDSAHDPLDSCIASVTEALRAKQERDGHWLYELEADATIPAEYIMLNHYLGTIDDDLEQRLAAYLRSIQGHDGGWPLFHGGEADVSATVKAYLALKLVGDDIDAPHMARARAVVRDRGGAARSNVFTRIGLALFGLIPWRGVPQLRVEAMLLPRWFPFHIDRVSYWSRTVMVPLLVLGSLKPVARNPRGIRLDELFLNPLAEETEFNVNPTGTKLGDMLLLLDRFSRAMEPIYPRGMVRRGVDRAMTFVIERMNGEDGLGAIFPAMANAVMALDALGYSHDDPLFVTARRAIDRLIVDRGGMAYCQPCVSPVWDTGLALHALLEAGAATDDPAVLAAAAWLRDHQILDVKGDWAVQRPDLRPGGWAFQYRNDFYPDVDDTAVVAMALDRIDGEVNREAVSRAVEWVVGMQSANGGWGAFDADNDNYHLNHIPFADHGALLDPPTADVSARCIGLLAQAGFDREAPVMRRALTYLRGEQEDDGSWFGRWGTNYIYGTWSALAAFNAVAEDPQAPHIRKAVDWLIGCQNADGGWGEDCRTYWDRASAAVCNSTPSQTAWALLALMAAGEVRNPAVRRGVDYLLGADRTDGKWTEEAYNAVGFPRVFFLKYHGYAAYFPLWALARYRNLISANATQPLGGL